MGGGGQTIKLTILMGTANTNSIARNYYLFFIFVFFSTLVDAHRFEDGTQNDGRIANGTRPVVIRMFYIIIFSWQSQKSVYGTRL